MSTQETERAGRKRLLLQALMNNWASDQMQYLKKSACFHFVWGKKKNLSQNRYCSSSLFQFRLLKSEKHSSQKLIKFLVEKKQQSWRENTYFLTHFNAGGAGSQLKHARIVNSVHLAEFGSGAPGSGWAPSKQMTAAALVFSWKREFIPLERAGSSPCPLSAGTGREAGTCRGQKAGTP